jgi:hypothetical protein
VNSASSEVNVVVATVIWPPSVVVQPSSEQREVNWDSRDEVGFSVVVVVGDVIICLDLALSATVTDGSSVTTSVVVVSLMVIVVLTTWNSSKVSSPGPELAGATRLNGNVAASISSVSTFVNGYMAAYSLWYQHSGVVFSGIWHEEKRIVLVGEKVPETASAQDWTQLHQGKATVSWHQD